MGRHTTYKGGDEEMILYHYHFCYLGETYRWIVSKYDNTKECKKTFKIFYTTSRGYEYSSIISKTQVDPVSFDAQWFYSIHSPEEYMNELYQRGIHILERQVENAKKNLESANNNLEAFCSGENIIDDWR